MLSVIPILEKILVEAFRDQAVLPILHVETLELRFSQAIRIRPSQFYCVLLVTEIANILQM